MRRIYIIFYCVLFAAVRFAAAQNTVNERVFVHTDKDCYFAGEEIYFKMLTVSPSFEVSTISKTGYIELSDTEKPYIQMAVALEGGKGFGSVRVPDNIPSGVYQLAGYTRYMLNEGEKCFFRSQIAVINAGRRGAKDRIVFSDDFEGSGAANRDVSASRSGFTVSASAARYSTRTPVEVFIEGFPDDVMDMTLSVYRRDSVAFAFQSADYQSIIDNMRRFDIINMPVKWLPEYEGHIITAKIIPEMTSKGAFLPNISVVGKDVRYVNGKLSDEGASDVTFYTKGIYNSQQIVSTLVGSHYEPTEYRIDVLPPFCGVLPDTLPSLRIYPSSKEMTTRHVAAQLNTLIHNKKNQISETPYSHLRNPITYMLDDYTRFNTLEETIFEFIYQLRVNTVGGKKVIRMFNPEEHTVYRGNTLVLLDGTPIHSHDKILEYNPYLIERVDICGGWTTFNGEAYSSIVAFTSFTGNLPSFRLGSESQLFDYEFPYKSGQPVFPEYADSVAKEDLTPDFRHTLYWNPSVETIAGSSLQAGKRIGLSFFTSDLCGEYEIRAEAITSSGKYLNAVSYFRVESKP